MSDHATIKKTKHYRKLGAAKERIALLEADVRHFRDRAIAAEAALEGEAMSARAADERADDAEANAKAEVARLEAAIRSIVRVTVTTTRLRGATDAQGYSLYRNAYNRIHALATNALGDQ